MVILIANGLPEIELDDLVCDAFIEKSSQFHAVVRKALLTNQFMNMQQFASLALDFKAQKVLSFLAVKVQPDMPYREVKNSKISRGY